MRRPARRHDATAGSRPPGAKASGALPGAHAAGPFPLLLLACSFALAGYAGVRLLADDWFAVALWFVGAALLHDLVLLPLYAMADRAAVRSLEAAGHRTWAL
ncbi:hypothetical protein [Streptomyces sp. SAS_272]|uniref:hypothetical protein n=1 Tax=Streptomyces sp. SAS_272 TaxID=3412747 RepID=UPI00403CB51E